MGKLANSKLQASLAFNFLTCTQWIAYRNKENIVNTNRRRVLELLRFENQETHHVYPLVHMLVHELALLDGLVHQGNISNFCSKELNYDLIMFVKTPF